MEQMDTSNWNILGGGVNVVPVLVFFKGKSSYSKFLFLCTLRGSPQIKIYLCYLRTF